MAFKDILVHLDNSPHGATRLALAVALAQRYKAHLTAVYVTIHPYYTPEHVNSERDAEEARVTFELETTGSGIASQLICLDCGVSGVGIAEIINHHAYHKDLVIIGQNVSDTGGTDTSTDLSEKVVAGSARPVLIVPSAGSFNSVGEHVMVAWRQGRESARALSDAMPFLLNARGTGLMVVHPPDAAGDDGGAGCTDICNHLALHGIEAKVERFAADGVSVGDVLLNQAWEAGCDLLVMGAYGYNHRGALSLGSVARHVLQHMNIPVLMSH